ncbi:MAG TPA: GxxExxY protein [Pyrinomonadaceae bacterium]|nr:GxxExxY protein [Pyrinomonadaceae bacterium]
MTKKLLDKLTYEVIGAAIEVHKAIGPGLLESVYHECLKHELRLRAVRFATELIVPVRFKGINLETDLRCDLLIEGILVVELKSVAALTPIHEAQLLTYMKLLEAPKGLLVNFNCVNIFKEGQKTFVNEFFRALSAE